MTIVYVIGVCLSLLMRLLELLGRIPSGRRRGVDMGSLILILIHRIIGVVTHPLVRPVV